MSVSDRLNYHNNVPLTSFLNIFTYDRKEKFFITTDRQLVRIWELPNISDETLNEIQKMQASNSLAYALNKYPEGTSGQIFKISHSDIRPQLHRYANSVSNVPFSNEISEAIVDLQLRGSIKGFFSSISDSMLEKAKNDSLNELDSSEAKEAFSYSIDKNVQDGRYALTKSQYVAFYFTPSWANRNLIKSAIKSFSDIFFDLFTRNKTVDKEKRYESEYTSDVNIFLDHCNKIEQAFLSSGLHISILSGQGYVEQSYRLCNPHRYTRTLVPKYTPYRTVREIVAAPDLKPGQSDLTKSIFFTPISPKKDGLQIDGIRYYVSSVGGLPQNTYPGMINDAIKTSEGEHWLSTNFTIPSQKAIRIKSIFRKSILTVKTQFLAGTPLEPNVKTVAKQTHDMDLIDSATDPESKENTLIANSSFHYITFGKDHKDAFTRAKEVEDTFWDQGYFESDRGDAIIHHSMLGNYDKNGASMLARSENIPITNVSDMSISFSGYQGCGELSSPTESEILVNNIQGEPIFVDVFGNHVVAGHSLIIGGTGSGKTFFFINKLLQISARVKTKIYLVDKGRNYEVFSDIMGGSYVDLVTDEEDGIKPTCINPFYVGKDKDGNSRLPKNRELEFIRSVLLSMIMSGTGEGTGVTSNLTKSDSTLIIKALKSLFEKDIHKEYTLSFFMEHMRNDYGTRGNEVADMLIEFSNEGVFGKLFDGPIGIDWNHDVICFETDRLSGSPAMPIAMMVLFNQINTFCKYRLKRSTHKIIGIDEAWSALADKTIALQIAGFFREMRKYRTAVFLISQTIKDFANLVSASSDNGISGILENTKHFFLMSCSEGDLEIGKALLGLSQQEINAWRNSSSLPPFYSECFYRCILNTDQPYSGRFRLYSNPISLWIASSAPKDIDLRNDIIDEKCRELNDVSLGKVSAISALAKKYPFGSSFGEITL